MKKLPLGIQGFKEIINGGYFYSDKTQYIYNLINNASYYFLSRPRRFGKSLLLDTIAEAFSGDKELFKGLWIYNSDYRFEKYPVLRLDMSVIANNTPEILINSISNNLRRSADDEGLSIIGDNPSDLLSHLIEALHKKNKQQIVVLIDEYDKPFLDHLQDDVIADANRMLLRSLYGVLKPMDPFLKFVFITGVSKFTKTSIFSGLNNFLDITMTKAYSCICGIPVDDLGTMFSDRIVYLSSLGEFKIYENLHDEILAWYDGYSWDGVTRLLNPFGLFSFFMQERFSSFWYASGSPSFLIKILKEKPATFLSLQNLEIRESMLDSFDVKKIGVASLLFQTGYLTVKEILHSYGPPVYKVDIPNKEVRESLYINILTEFSEQDSDTSESAYLQLKNALRTGELSRLRDIFKGLFASIPYQLHVDREVYYHSIFYAVMSLLGFDMSAEVSTSKGRIDAVLELDDVVYVMEFKYCDCGPDAAPAEKRKMFDNALEEGMNQIKSKGYADKFAGSEKEIRLAAFAFLGRDDIEMRTETLT